MAIQYDGDTGHPYLSNQSLLSDVPAYTQALMAANLTPVGVIMPYMGLTAPDYWLLCDGRDYDVDKLPELAAVNVDFHLDGTFRVPDLRGRSPMGAGVKGDDIIVDYPVGQRRGDRRLGNHNHGRTGDDSPDHSHAIETSDYSFGQNNSAGGYGSTLGSMAHMPKRHISTLGAGVWFGPNPGGSLSPTRHQHDTSSAGEGLSGNLSPVTMVTFIVYAGRPTRPPVDLGGSGQPMDLSTTTRLMQERLSDSDVSEWEKEMINAKLNGEPWPPEPEVTEPFTETPDIHGFDTKGQLP